MPKTVKVTPQEAAAQWVSRLSSSQQRIEAGVARVQTAPGQAAAAALQKYLAGVQEAANKWRARVASVSLADWQNSMKQVGIPRIAQGAQAKQGKMESFMAEFLPVLDRNLSQVDSMPADTYEQRKARAVRMMDLNHGFKRGTGAAA